MKKLIAVSALALLALSAVAVADGMPKGSMKDTHEALPWAGCYAGANIGYDWSNVSNDSTAEVLGAPIPQSSLSSSASPKGFMGGVQAGCNIQRDRLVYGVETDLDLSSVTGSGSQSLPLGGPFALVSEFSQRLSYFGTLRGRLGVTASDKVLLYVTGGLAYGRVETTTHYGVAIGGTGIFFDGSSAETKFGWTLGGGAEYALADRWTLKGEYLYYRLGGTGHRTDVVPGILAINHDQNGLHGNIVRMGLNYKF